MALPDSALITVETLADEVGAQMGRQHLARAERYVKAASAQIARYCGVGSFHYLEDVEESVAGYGSTELLLARRPIVEVVSVFRDGTEVDPDTYTIQGDGESGVLYRSRGWAWTARMARPPTYAGEPGSEERAYQVTYAAGYVTPVQAADGGTWAGNAVTLPDDLQHAAVLLAAQYWRDRDRDLKMINTSSADRSATFTQGLPPEVRELIDHYRRPEHAG